MPRSTTATPTMSRRRTMRRTRAMGKEHGEAMPEVNVGQRLRELRLERSLSIRSLAERSGLNVNA